MWEQINKCKEAGFQKKTTCFSLGTQNQRILHPDLLFSSALWGSSLWAWEHTFPGFQILSLIRVSKLTDLLTVLALKLWKINPYLKLKTAYYKSLSRNIGDIWLFFFFFKWEEQRNLNEQSQTVIPPLIQLVLINLLWLKIIPAF